MVRMRSSKGMRRTVAYWLLWRPSDKTQYIFYSLSCGPVSVTQRLYFQRLDISRSFAHSDDCFHEQRACDNGSVRHPVSCKPHLNWGGDRVYILQMFAMLLGPEQSSAESACYYSRKLARISRLVAPQKWYFDIRARQEDDGWRWDGGNKIARVLLTEKRTKPWS